MNSKKVYAILDTETTFEGQRVYNIGYIIVNSKGFPLFEREMHFTDVLADNMPFYGWRKVESIKGVSEPITKEMGYGKMLADFEHYGVTTVCAYNAAFDTGVIAKDGILLAEKFEVMCLWSLSCHLICNQAYVKWAVKNGRESDKGNLRSNAENVYSYISGITDFEEAHTALADCRIELEIFRAIQRKKVKVAELANYASTPAPWRIVQDLRKELGL
jgi:DNA polymerase III epsilon subunit-like protein